MPNKRDQVRNAANARMGTSTSLLHTDGPLLVILISNRYFAN
jgi:hypothetical protein